MEGRISGPSRLSVLRLPGSKLKTMLMASGLGRHPSHARAYSPRDITQGPCAAIYDPSYA